jgi:hypothetical protein
LGTYFLVLAVHAHLWRGHKFILFNFSGINLWEYKCDWTSWEAFALLFLVTWEICLLVAGMYTSNLVGLQFIADEPLFPGNLWTMSGISRSYLPLKCNKWVKKVSLLQLLCQAKSFLIAPATATWIDRSLETQAIPMATWIDRILETRAMGLHPWGLLTTKADARKTRNQMKINCDVSNYFMVTVIHPLSSNALTFFRWVKCRAWSSLSCILL